MQSMPHLATPLSAPAPRHPASRDVRPRRCRPCSVPSPFPAAPHGTAHRDTTPRAMRHHVTLLVRVSDPGRACFPMLRIQNTDHSSHVHSTPCTTNRHTCMFSHSNSKPSGSWTAGRPSSSSRASRATACACAVASPHARGQEASSRAGAGEASSRRRLPAGVEGCHRRAPPGVEACRRRVPPGVEAEECRRHARAEAACRRAHGAVACRHEYDGGPHRRGRWGYARARVWAASRHGAEEGTHGGEGASGCAAAPRASAG